MSTKFSLNLTSISLAVLACAGLPAKAQTTETAPAVSGGASAPATSNSPTASPAKSSTNTAQLERVEITGSSVKRIAAESALPVQVITLEQIKKSGATTVAEVIQKLPAMQGFQVADIAIGTNSGGLATASIHDIGASYTLVLLNGRRLAPFEDGNRVNLNTIPMSAIERIEVLTDGASALYGADAIAGVVNFILKKEYSGLSMEVEAQTPLAGGGESKSLSVTYGKGEVGKDEFSFVVTAKHDEQKQLKSGDRDFAKTAYIPFQKDGKQYIYDRTSLSTIPANAAVTFNNTAANPSYSFNPYQKATGSCGPGAVLSLSNGTTSTSIAENCAFDFVSTIDIYPESSRDSLFAAGKLKAVDGLTFYSDVAITRQEVIARIAPNPVPITIAKGSDLFNKYIVPNLTAAQLADVKAVSASYRAVDFGTRNSQTITETQHIVLGADAELAGWDVNGAVTRSTYSIDERYIGGYFKKTEFTNLISSNTLDPFVLGGQQSAATQQKIAASIFNGSIRTSETTLTGADLRASREVFDLPAGAVSLGMGGDFRIYHYQQIPDKRAVDGEIYNYAAVPAFDFQRKNAGVFGEVLVPVVQDLEVTAAMRRDIISSITDVSKGTNVGSRMQATTAKISARFQPTSALLFRGSAGTGFKAPDMLDIARPLTASGVTATSYACPFPGTPECKVGIQQYSRISGGNALLKAERSRQATVGLRFEPNAQFGIGLDYWRVAIRDAVSAVSENLGFSNPNLYRDLFTTYRTPAESQNYWAFILASTNIGLSLNRGIDWDVIARTQTPWGRLTGGLTGTYLIDSDYNIPGTQTLTDSVGKYGINGAVSFRNIIRATVSLDSGDFSNTITVAARSGYKDKTQTVRDVAAGVNTTVTLDVPRYATVDWQGTYKYSKDLDLRAGVKNLFDKAPPLTLRDSSGHQVGYDPRYASPLLRTLTLNANYKFY